MGCARRSSTTFAATLCLLVPCFVGCARPTPGQGDQALACIDPEGASAGVEAPHGFSAPVPIRFRPVALPAGQSRVVFLNRGPRTYVAGVDDAQAGSSSVLSAQGLESASLPAFTQGDRAWRSVVACVREQFARFDVAVTDVRPVTSGFIEAHFGGKGPELGIEDGSGGIAPIDAASCSVVDGAVVFVFSDLFGQNVRSICEVGAHEIAHAFSLDHAYRCKDPMTYIQGCGEKAFLEEAAPCGEAGERPCICGRPSQSSVEVMRGHLGDRHSDLAPPLVELLPPVASPTGRNTFLQVRAQDVDAALTSIELHVVDADGVELSSRCGDGRIPCTLDGALASFVLPPAAVDRRVWAVAEDTGGNRSASLEVIVHAGAPGAGELSLAVAPVAARYPADAVVELQALVVGVAPIVEAVAVWSDGEGEVREQPLCPRGNDGRYGVAMHLGRGANDRSFQVRVRDALGHVVLSAPELVRLATSP